jgi:hypothetical protein
MGTVDFLPRSQEPANCPYHTPDQAIVRPHNTFL